MNSLRQSATGRNPLAIEEIHRIARTTPGPVAVFVGSSHANMVNELVKRGVKVTLYHATDFSPVTPALIGIAPGAKATAGERMRHIFQEVLATYLRQRYSLRIGELEGVAGHIQGLEKLRKIPQRTIRDMFQNGSEMTEATFRRHLVNFLTIHGVKLPSNEEMEELKQRPVYHQFRKVKVFEPGKHFVK